MMEEYISLLEQVREHLLRRFKKEVFEKEWSIYLVYLAKIAEYLEDLKLAKKEGKEKEVKIIGHLKVLEKAIIDDKTLHYGNKILKPDLFERINLCQKGQSKWHPELNKAKAREDMEKEFKTKIQEMFQDFKEIAEKIDYVMEKYHDLFGSDLIKNEIQENDQFMEYLGHFSDLLEIGENMYYRPKKVFRDDYTNSLGEILENRCHECVREIIHGSVIKKETI